MATIRRRALRALATHEAVHGETLRAAGLSRGAIRNLVLREHLFRAHRDVYFIVDNPPRKGVWIAAVWRCGPGAVLSHLSAAALWEVIDDPGGPPQVTVPDHRCKRPPRGIDVHRSTTLSQDMAWHRDDIPVTSLHRTIDDFARACAERTLRSALGRAERRHAVDLAVLAGGARSAKLRRVLAGYVAGRGMTDSEAEALFYEICATTSLPRPKLQRRVPGGRADFVWPELGLVVEVDGYGTHSGRVAFRDDRRRDRENLNHGFEPVRFTWDDLVATPREVARDLELAHLRLRNRAPRLLKDA